MAGKNNIRDKAKQLWIKSMKSIGDTATNIANNTKFKVDEMTLQNRRRELMGDLSHAVYTLWMKGTEFPPELTKMLEELQQLDDRLNDMRTEKFAQGQTSVAEKIPEEESTAVSSEKNEESGKGQEAEGSEEDEEVGETILIASSSLQSEINGCFDHEASVDKMAEKVNTSLDQLTDKIRAFSPEVSTEKTENVENTSEETE